MTFANHQPAASSDSTINTPVEFDFFYSTTLGLLTQFYHEQTVTMTTLDPEYITEEIKSKLKRKNKLVHAGRIEEASWAHWEGHDAAHKDLLLQHWC